MPIFMSPDGNFEVWETKPAGYFNVEEWEKANPPKLLSEAEKTQQRLAEIQQELTTNDLASVRPLRAKLAGTATEFDETRLAELEEQAQALRTELATLTTKLQELSDQPTE